MKKVNFSMGFGAIILALVLAGASAFTSHSAKFTNFKYYRLTSAGKSLTDFTNSNYAYETPGVDPCTVDANNICNAQWSHTGTPVAGDHPVGSHISGTVENGDSGF